MIDRLIDRAARALAGVTRVSRRRGARRKRITAHGGQHRVEHPQRALQALQQLELEGARAALAALSQRLTPDPLDSASAQELLSAAVAAAGVKKGLLMKSLRAALLGCLQGPDLLETWLLLHRLGEDKPRLERAL